MFMTSLKTSAEASDTTHLSIFPKIFQWVNYINIWEKVSVLKGAFNTVIIEITVIPVGTFVTGMAAFSFSKLKLKHKNFWLMVLMSGMMVPYAALLLPQYRVYMMLGWTNTLLPLIIPGLFGNISMLFFFIQYMKGLPSALIEAAKIDSAPYFVIYVKIIIPLMGPAIAAQIIFWFVGIWNDYFAPSIYLTQNNVKTLQVILAGLNSSVSSGNNWPIIMTGAIITSLPLFVIYIIFQRFFIESMAITGIK